MPRGQASLHEEYLLSEMGDDDRRAPEGVAEFRPAGAPGDDPITRSLKKAFDEVAAEPIPDELMRLLAQLDVDDQGEAR